MEGMDQDSADSRMPPKSEYAYAELNDRFVKFMSEKSVIQIGFTKSKAHLQ